MADNTGEPFGLPTGTVRGILALALTGSTIYLFVTGQPVPDPLLAINALVVGNYFGSRATESATKAAVEAETVQPPYIPEDQPKP